MKKFAFVFPGQGSQAVGMMSAFENVVSDTFEQASTVLGYDLWDIVQNNPDDRLNQTQYTQPALLTASIVAWRVWQQQTSLQPAMLAGHSLGEYSALVCAGAIDFTDGVKLVAARGEAMQAAGEGALAAIIGLSDEAVTDVCQAMAEGEVLSPANFNCPGQVVIAGTKAAVARVVSVAKSKGAKMAKLLPVSVPSHCLLMASAVEKVQSVLAGMTIKEPALPVVNNVDVKINTDPDAIRDALLRQLTSPVQWVKTIQFFIDQDIKTLVECGPGKVLTGINKRIDRTLVLTSFSDPDTLTQTIETLA